MKPDLMFAAPSVLSTDVFSKVKGNNRTYRVNSGNNSRCIFLRKFNDILSFNFRNNLNRLNVGFRTDVDVAQELCWFWWRSKSQSGTIDCKVTVEHSGTTPFSDKNVSVQDNRARVTKLRDRIWRTINSDTECLGQGVELR